MAGFGANVHLQHIIGQNTLDGQTQVQKQKKGLIFSQTEWFGLVPRFSLGSKAVE